MDRFNPWAFLRRPENFSKISNFSGGMGRKCDLEEPETSRETSSDEEQTSSLTSQDVRKREGLPAKPAKPAKAAKARGSSGGREAPRLAPEECAEILTQAFAEIAEWYPPGFLQAIELGMPDLAQEIRQAEAELDRLSTSRPTEATFRQAAERYQALLREALAQAQEGGIRIYSRMLDADVWLVRDPEARRWLEDELEREGRNGEVVLTFAEAATFAQMAEDDARRLFAAIRACKAVFPGSRVVQVGELEDGGEKA